MKSANHACRTFTVADEMERNEIDEMSVDKWRNQICGRGKWEKSRENLPRPRFLHQETYRPMSDRDANLGPRWWEAPRGRPAIKYLNNNNNNIIIIIIIIIIIVLLT